MSVLDHLTRRPENPPESPPVNLPESDSTLADRASALNDGDVQLPPPNNSGHDYGVGSNASKQLGSVVLKSVVSLIILAGSVAVFLILSGSKSAPEAINATKPATFVEIAEVKSRPQGIDYMVDGFVIPSQEVEVPAEVDGIISRRTEICRIGQVVKKGDLLFEIDSKDFQLEVRLLEEQVKQSRAEITELETEIEGANQQVALAKEDLEIKQRESKRLTDLRDPGAYSKSELDTVKATELASRNALQTAIDKAALLTSKLSRLNIAYDLANLELEKASLDLARTQIVAPISGVIIQEPVDQGTFVQRGGTVLIIQDEKTMEVRCSLEMKAIEWLWQAPGHPLESSNADPQSDERTGYRFVMTPVTVTYETASAKYEWEGNLNYFDGGRVDESTRLVPCRVTVENNSPKVTGRSQQAELMSEPPLMAGMFVSVIIHTKPASPLLTVPEAALQPGGRVWVVDDGKLRECQLSIAHSTKEEVIVYADSDLQPGDRVVTSPLVTPRPGDPVTLAESL